MLRELFIQPALPYSFVANAEYVTHYRGSDGTDRFDGEVFTRPVHAVAGRLVSVMEAAPASGTGNSQLRVCVEDDAADSTALSAVREEIARVLGAHGDPSPFYELADREPGLRGLAREYYGLHIPQASSLFEALAWAILGQQISAHAAKALRTRVMERYGSVTAASDADRHAFPCAEALATADHGELRSLGLSNRKAEYLSGVARLFASGELTHEGLAQEDDDEVKERLLALRGVGPWTAQWLLLRGLGREDAFPAGDVALQRVLGELVRGSAFTEGEALRFAERHRPYRSYLTVYVFAAIRSRRVTPSEGARRER